MTVRLGHAPVPVLGAYEAALRGGRCTLEGPGRRPTTLPVHRWCAPADAGDRAVLSRCAGRTVDLGCGPGRMAAELRQRGHPVLGVDISVGAVRLARARGVPAIRGDVLLPLPGEGAWETALLADGNVGIGGDPVALLDRVRRLVLPEGRIVVDLAPPGTGLRVHEVRLVVGDLRSDLFPWGVLGVDAVHEVASDAGLSVEVVDHWRGRWYAVLCRPTDAR